MPFCLLPLLGLAGCVAETPVTTTTEVTRETVTTGPVATRPVTREVLVTQAPPPVRVETRTVAPGPSYVWTNGYWQWTGAGYQWVPAAGLCVHDRQQSGLKVTGCDDPAAGSGLLVTGSKISGDR